MNKRKIICFTEYEKLLDWNQPSIDFYLSFGSEPMKDWTVYRIAGNTLSELAKEE